MVMMMMLLMVVMMMMMTMMMMMMMMMMISYVSVVISRVSLIIQSIVVRNGLLQKRCSRQKKVENTI